MANLNSPVPSGRWAARRGTLVVLDELTLVYVDFGGGGAETVAHVREPGNGRTTLMWTALSGPPTVVRVHGRGEVVFRDDVRSGELFARFPAEADEGQGSARAIVVVHARRVSDACGYAVPLMEHQEDRQPHADYFNRATEGGFNAYRARRDHIATSLDGLPALPLPLPPLPRSGHWDGLRLAGAPSRA
ncbi:pyridoxamine 5'-phosphate oxidase family protein [Streptomyces sp. NPDC085481]|uniref:pyridoxamine 5'-phosphate oxidase family protein n=1 Tax=Streptomyces sp. NPDC085481 TaxID=3365727 RepID=UPI0037CE3DE7